MDRYQRVGPQGVREGGTYRQQRPVVTGACCGGGDASGLEFGEDGAAERQVQCLLGETVGSDGAGLPRAAVAGVQHDPCALYRLAGGDLGGVAARCPHEIAAAGPPDHSDRNPGRRDQGSREVLLRVLVEVLGDVALAGGREHGSGGRFRLEQWRARHPAPDGGAGGDEPQGGQHPFAPRAVGTALLQCHLDAPVAVAARRDAQFLHATGGADRHGRTRQPAPGRGVGGHEPLLRQEPGAPYTVARALLQCHFGLPVRVALRRDAQLLLRLTAGGRGHRGDDADGQRGQGRH